MQLSRQYPANEELGTHAADLQRSLAWLDPTGPREKIAAAVSIENSLLLAQPANTARLERIGDILADHASGDAAALAPSTDYWRRIPAVAPGNRDLYLESATVFWDYFQFDDALGQIRQARQRFSEPALFGYQAGAIAEAKGDIAGAVGEYTAAALVSQQSEGEAHSRLLLLARRKSTAQSVDTGTAAVLQKENSLPALRLRVEVLQEQQRPAEIVPLLLGAVERAQTVDELADIATYASEHNQPTVREAALDRESRVVTDPVQRIQLRYELAASYEGRGAFGDAARVIESVYRDSPRLLGVVRATVDFDWRTKHPKDAVRVLVESSRVSRPPYADQFTAEASEKANSSGDVQQARALAESLLAKHPYDARDLSLIANTYTSDSAELARFYQSRLDALRTDTMAADLRKERTALLRRGLIPALAKSGDNTGAMDQYIALASVYPEDTSLVNEAALFALRTGRKQQWLQFLTATTQASLRDSRFFADLAITQSLFGDPAPAVDAYAHAIAIRSDRVDWFVAKASLEDSLGRFDDEAADDTKLYQLTYHDPQWMIAVARTRARQGKTSDAVSALETALLHGAQSTPHDYFAVASQLESWGLIEQARHDAETGAAKAGSNLLNADGKFIEETDATAYARILMRAHAADAVLASLRTDFASFHATPPARPQASTQDTNTSRMAVSEAEWQRGAAEIRYRRAATAFTSALRTVAETADAYGTPEERATFATLLEAQAGAASDDDLRSRWIPVAQIAHLAALDGKWRAILLLRPEQRAGNELQSFNTLERARMMYAELADVLGQFATAHTREAIRVEAHTLQAQAQLADGSEAAALRTLAGDGGTLATPATRDLYLRLLLRRDPNRLAVLAGSSNEELADASANLAVAQEALPQALTAVAARGRALPLVWTTQYRAFAGLYDRDSSPATGDAFRSALAWNQTIGEHLAAKPDTTQQLTSAMWFYTAARYGQWLQTASAQGEAEDAMTADVEHNRDSISYRALAQSYVEAGHPETALVELGHALELEPGSPSLEDATAVVLWGMNRHNDAVAAWRRSFADLRIVEDRRGAVPETFWANFNSVTQHVAERRLADQLRSGMEDVLRFYLARNGTYRSGELLQAAFNMSSNTDTATADLLTLASASSEQLDILSALDYQTWLPVATRERVLTQELQIARAQAGTASNNDAFQVDYRVQAAQRKLLALYMKGHRDREARNVLAAMNQQQRNEPENRVAELVLAGRVGTLRTLLNGYVASPDDEPAGDAIRKAVAQLTRESSFEAAQQLLEFDFSRAETMHTLETGQYLALAEARLRTGDVDGALALFRTLASSGGDTYANLDNAAALLEAHDRFAEALSFLQRLTTSVPWEINYAVRLAEAQSKTKTGDPAPMLRTAAANKDAPYALRVRAARDLAELQAPALDLGSGELNLLASNHVSAAAAEQPFFTLARARAAQEQTDLAAKALLLRENIAISPYGPETDTVRKALFETCFAARNMNAARSTLDDWMMERAQANQVGQSFAIYQTNSSDIDDENRRKPAEIETPALLDAMAAVYLATDARSQAEAALRRERNARKAGEAAQRALTLKIETLEAIDRLQAANAARPPLVHKALDQGSIVRARLETAPPAEVTREEP